jgi:cytochrome b561
MKFFIKFILVLIVVALAVALAYLRIHGEKGEVFQAAAHIYMGIMIALWVVARWFTTAVGKPSFYGTIVAVLSVIETACFLASGGHLKP